MSALTIFGNSHTVALHRGVAKVPEASDVKVFGIGNGSHETMPFSVVESGRVMFTQSSYARNLRKFTGLEYVDPELRWGICMGTHNARLYRDRFWAENAAPANMATDTQRPISTGMIDRMADEDQRHIREFLSQLKKTGVDFVVISAPPVRADHENIKRGANPNVLVEIDRRSRARFRAFLDDLGVRFIDFPGAAVDECGTLRAELAAKKLSNGKPDPHHGNAKYGAMMMRKIMNELEQAA